MTSLASLVYIDRREDDSHESYITLDDKRMTLAYENLDSIPYNLVDNYGSFISILDLSYNRFQSFDFLVNFENLTSLIIDHNDIHSDIILPYMPQLELLWLNHNKVIHLYRFVRNLQRSVPNLQYLSMMGNAAAPSYLNGGTYYEYLQYRLFVISWFPNLIHLDDRFVTQDQRDEAHRLFKRPFLERLRMNCGQSEYLQLAHDKFYEFVDVMEQKLSRQRKSSII